MTGTETVLSSKYPAKNHADKLVEFLKASGHDVGNAIIYLEGQKTHMKEDNDEEAPFRQRRYFFYLSGCDVPDCSLAYNVPSKKLTLFIPPVDPASVIWSGLPMSPEEALEKYDVDEALTTEEVNGYLSRNVESIKKAGGQTTAYAIPGQVSDSVTFLPFDKTNFSVIKDAIERCRVVKDSYEVALIRKANDVSSLAHAAVLEQAKSATNERELEAVFVAKSMANGCQQAYHSIIASGTNAATLHYSQNNEPLKNRLNLLVDAGAEYSCYCADVTRTFPISGMFSRESKLIYDLVDEMQRSCFAMLKEGVSWESVHENSHRVAIRGLKAAGILIGDDNELFDKRVSVAFYPHGLGHYLGEDTHDTGGNANYADKDPMFKYLRVRGTLPAGCVITVEPGIYFCRFIIDPLLNDPELSQYVNKAVLDRFWEVGGVRIEDDVHITKDGYENLTTAPKI